jgi:catechol 2,3-dioxygenase-like lactoylglutathione lyase family enzyme
MTELAATPVGLALPPLMQVGFAVRDAAASAAFFERVLGLGPFEFQEATLDGDYRYRGAPSSCRMKLATVQSGEVQIELIEMLEGQHPCGAHLEEHGEGINHLAFEVDDLDAMTARLDSRGMTRIAEGSVALESGLALRYVWFEGQEPSAPQLEFVEFTSA